MDVIAPKNGNQALNGMRLTELYEYLHDRRADASLIIPESLEQAVEDLKAATLEASAAIGARLNDEIRRH